MGIFIGLDFDGTCVTHEYPKVGDDIGAVPVLKKLVDNGNYLILNTMRSSHELGDAIDWFRTNNIPLYGVGINPNQVSWTSSSKCYAQLYIDDSSLGAPLTIKKIKNDKGEEVNVGRPYIDWGVVENYLIEMELIK